MTEFKQLQDAADMTTKQVAEYFEVTERTVFRWRSGESQPSAVVMWLMGNLATIRFYKDNHGEGNYERSGGINGHGLHMSVPALRR